MPFFSGSTCLLNRRIGQEGRKKWAGPVFGHFMSGGERVRFARVLDCWSAPLISPPALRMTPVDAAQPRAIGDMQLFAIHDRGCSQISGLRQQGSLKVLFPRPAGAALEAVILNTAGGLTGGDRMQTTVETGPGAHVVVSTQAAERAYRAQRGSRAEVDVTLTVAAGGRIDWLPQETILYEGCALARRLRVNLASSGKVLLVEPLIFGRAAMGETLRNALLRDRWDICRDGQLLFADALHLTGDVQALLDRTGGAGAMASLMYAGSDAGRFLNMVRSLIPVTAGASLIRDGLLFVRILAHDGFDLRKVLFPVIECLSAAPLPKVWRL